MITAGIDIGSMSCKVVIMDDSAILGSAVAPTGSNSVVTSAGLYEQLMRQCNLQKSDIEAVVSTGYGRVNVPFATKNVTEITCHAIGNHWYFPEMRSILDMGGQDCKAIRCDDRGRVMDFVMNEKCAAGTGRYIERIAALTGVELDRVGELSLEASDPAALNSLCLVHAEQNVLRLLIQGRDKRDILAGACDHIVKNILSLLNKVGGAAEAFCISGGVAKNQGVVERLEKELGMKALTAPDPQIIGAVGAAQYARSLL